MLINHGGYMNTVQNQYGNKRLAKLVAENTALNSWCSDMSDVNFEIGKSSNSVKIFMAIVFLLSFSADVFFLDGMQEIRIIVCQLRT